MGLGYTKRVNGRSSVTVGARRAAQSADSLALSAGHVRCGPDGVRPPCATGSYGLACQPQEWKEEAGARGNYTRPPCGEHGQSGHR